MEEGYSRKVRDPFESPSSAFIVSVVSRMQAPSIFWTRFAAIFFIESSRLLINNEKNLSVLIYSLLNIVFSSLYCFKAPKINLGLHVMNFDIFWLMYIKVAQPSFDYSFATVVRKRYGQSAILSYQLNHAC